MNTLLAGAIVAVVVIAAAAFFVMQQAPPQTGANPTTTSDAIAQNQAYNAVDQQVQGTGQVTQSDIDALFG